MDLKQVKPIHLRCPDCGYDFSYSTNHIESEIDRLKKLAADTRTKINQMKGQGYTMKSPEYKRAVYRYDKYTRQLTEFKTARKNAVVEIEKQKQQIFNQKVKHLIGEEKYIKLKQEAEEELVYNNYDMAIQDHTNFENA